MMGVFSNNRFLKRVNPEIVRAKDDSGSSLNHPEIQRLMRQMVDLDIADNLKLWVHNGLVKTRTSGSDLYVPKAYDISGEENDAVEATEDNQPELVSDGLEFDGSNDLLDAGDDSGLRITNNLSVFLWVYVPEYDTSTNTYITGMWAWNNPSNQRAYSIGTGSEPSMRFLLSSAGTGIDKRYRLEDIHLPSIETWHHLGFTFSSNNLLVYHNGVDVTANVEKATDNTVNTIHQSTAPYVVGASSQLSNHFNGTLNDIRTFNTALSSTEVSAIYNQTKGFYGIT